jgi:hypothetical protein
MDFVVLFCGVICIAISVASLWIIRDVPLPKTSTTSLWFTKSSMGVLFLLGLYLALISI